MNKYPYYVAALMDAGVLRKIFNYTKFKSHNDAVMQQKIVLNDLRNLVVAIFSITVKL